MNFIAQIKRKNAASWPPNRRHHLVLGCSPSHSLHPRFREKASGHTTRRNQNCQRLEKGLRTREENKKAQNHRPTMKNRLTALKERAEIARASHAYRAESVAIRFTEELVALMAKKAVTRSALAEKIEVSPAYITKILKGDTNFTLDTMVKISAALDCDLSTHLTDRGFETRWFDVSCRERILSVANHPHEISSHTFDHVEESPFALSA